MLWFGKLLIQKALRERGVLTRDSQFLGRMDLVLFLWPTVHFQPMVLERAEDVRGL
jgi:hypothetical protein